MDAPVAYDRHFFARQVPWQPEYEAIADALLNHLSFSSVLDLGCGSGFIIARLATRGREVTGVDGSPSAHIFAPPEVQPRILIRDLSLPLDLGQYDLVLCTEVAEHLPAADADTLVGSICRHARSSVFFTAALPGQGGIGHLNEQPHGYWIEKFRLRGFGFDRDRTAKLRQDLWRAVKVIKWFARNALVFRPVSDAGFNID